jgi:hypothetical protein
MKRFEMHNTETHSLIFLLVLAQEYFECCTLFHTSQKEVYKLKENFKNSKTETSYILSV